MSSTAFVLIDPSSDSLCVYDSPIEAEIYLFSYTTIRLFSTKLSSSNCTKVLIPPVFSWDDVPYRVYETDGCTRSISEYGHDVYANALENVL